MNNPKTTGIAALGAIVLLILIFALITHRLRATEFAEVTGTVGTFLGVLVGIFAQDGKKAA